MNCYFHIKRGDLIKKSLFCIHLTEFFVTLHAKQKSGCRNGGMVDTRDLKSLGHNGCVGSSPTFGTKTSRIARMCQIGTSFFLCNLLQTALPFHNQADIPAFMSGISLNALQS